ncbi:MAG: hypothetical protein ACP5RP_04085 [Candidatus Micrarchaeia archaeon]
MAEDIKYKVRRVLEEFIEKQNENVYAKNEEQRRSDLKLAAELYVLIRHTVSARKTAEATFHSLGKYKQYIFTIKIDKDEVKIFG